MCWQCITPPWIYLPGVTLVEGPSYITGAESYPPATIEWCSETFETNPAADWLFAGEALPGDLDADGLPYFIPAGVATRPPVRNG